MRTVGRVLVIEEDALLRWSLLHYLADVGREVRAIADLGSVSAELAERPDVIVFDLDLPRATAEDWLRLLREAAPRTSLIATTARSDEANERAARDAGAAAVLRKPFDLRELRDLLRAMPAAPTPEP